MAGKKTANYKLYLMLLPCMALWMVFSEWELTRDFYQPLENLALDWRIRARGEQAVPEVKIAYVNIDAATVSAWGERPWNRGKYADLADCLLRIGQARCVGFDLILSSESYAADLVSREKIKASDKAMSKVIRGYPHQIVLGANFTRFTLPKTIEERGIDETLVAITAPRSELPVFYHDQVKPADTYPEGPSFPLVSESWGAIGLIGEDSTRNKDSVPRWIPLFADTNGPYHSIRMLEGYCEYYGVDFEQCVKLEGDRLRLVVDEGRVIADYPYIQPKRFYHFAIELILQYLELGHEHVTLTDDFLTIGEKEKDNFIQIPLAEKQLLEVNWFTRFPIFTSKEDAIGRKKFDESEPAWFVLQSGYNYDYGAPEQRAAAEQFFQRFKDAIVLVGPTDRTLQDLAPTPLDNVTVPKVGMHGNAIKTILSEQFIQRLPNWVKHLATVLLTGCVACISIRAGKHSFLFKGIGAMLLIGYILFAFVIFLQIHLVMPLVAPVLSAVTTTFFGVSYQLAMEEKRRSRIQGMFGTYLSPTLVTQMIDSGKEPSLGGVDETITAFFSDVQGFSAFSEQLEPTQLVDLMNEYLTAMTEILLEQGAYVDKYIGDAIVAMYNAPVTIERHALLGCKSALLMQNRQMELRAKWALEGDKWPDVVANMQTRIGLNTGNATVGNMGSKNHFNYTMMGDTVNLAARCESGAKAYGAYIMVAEETYKQAIAAGDDVVFRYMDRIVVKGRTQPVGVYEVVCLQDELNDATKQCLAYFAAGFLDYQAQRWDDALKKFVKAARLEPNVPGVTPGVTVNPSTVFIERCCYYKDDPPGEDWDGVFVMKTK